MGEIAKILLAKEREFLKKYCKNVNRLSDEQVDEMFDKTVKKILEENI